MKVAVVGATGLVGTWVGLEESEYTVILFTGTHYYLSDYQEENGYGTESGTYTYNVGTSQFSFTILDFNY